MHPAVFLDRDGTIITDIGHLHRIEDIRLIPRSAAAIRALRESGYVVVVVSNQSVVARGMVTEKGLRLINSAIDDELARDGAKVDAWYCCPHHPRGSVARYRMECDCRKPEPGLLLRAANDMNIDLASSWMVGDSVDDVEAGRRAGVRTIRIGSETADLHSAVDLILALDKDQGLGKARSQAGGCA